MFTDLMNESSIGTLQLNSTGLGLDDFQSFVTESDAAIEELIESYRMVMTEALQESAGQLNESTDKVAEQANEHVGQKIVAALKKLWDMIQRMFNASINFIRALVTSNKSFIEKVKPAVQKKNLSSDELKKITMNSYDYKPEIIVLGNVGKLLAFANSLSKTPYTEQTKAECDAKVAEFKESKKGMTGAGKVVAAEQLIQGGMTEKSDWGKFKDELHQKLLGGGKKTVKTFSMDYFNKIEGYTKNVEDITKLLDSAKKEFGTIIENIKKTATEAKGGKDKQFRSGQIAYLNLLRGMVSMNSEAFMEMKKMKLDTLKRELQDARAFCMYAYRFKGGSKEGVMAESAIIPLDPLFEADGDGDDDDYLDESAGAEPEFTF